MKAVKFGKKNIIPSKIVCVGRNYVDHIKELSNEIPENMVIFIKPNSAISDQLISYHWEPIHYEAEISFMYENGKFSAVAFGFDLTKRGLQSNLKGKGLPWERAKAFDGAAVFSEFVAISQIDAELTVELEINKELIQSGSVKQMIYKPDGILKEIKTFLTLNDGDIVMTGTPKGVGVIQKGSTYVGSIKNASETLVSGVWKAI